MSYSKEAESYWKGDHIRYLNDDNSIPSVEDRVKAAFDSGVKSVHKRNWYNSFGKLNAIAHNKCQINFPNYNE
jgi:hypothetical protein